VGSPWRAGHEQPVEAVGAERVVRIDPPRSSRSEPSRPWPSATGHRPCVHVNDRSQCITRCPCTLDVARNLHHFVGLALVDSTALRHVLRQTTMPALLPENGHRSSAESAWTGGDGTPVTALDAEVFATRPDILVRSMSPFDPVSVRLRPRNATRWSDAGEALCTDSASQLPHLPSRPGVALDDRS
jgi:hypothetical protein